MRKTKHILRVLLKSKNSDVLYNGNSIVNKIISDEILIKGNKIDIIFYRSKKMKVNDVLNSPDSNIRKHLQKCLCFFLAVMGEIPDVRAVTYICRTEKFTIEHKKFTQTWKNCYAQITLPIEQARIIFDCEKGHKFYVMLTYFLKAQLDYFSHDRFRAAWSALNAMYSYIAECEGDENAKEWKKLKILMQTIDIMPMDNALAIIEDLDESVWKNISWYHLFTHEDKGKVKERFCDCYDDKLILKMVKKNALGISQKVTIEDINSSFLNELDRKIKCNIIKPADRLKFIIRKECYSRRNHSFHAERPYPLFVISNSIESNNENTLTEIVLLTIKDLFISFAGKQE